MASPDNCLVLTFVSYMGGCDLAAETQQWRMDGIGGKNPIYTFGNISYLSLNAGVRVRGVWSCPASHQVPKVPKLPSPRRRRGDQTQKHRLKGKQGWQRATSPDSALPWWHQSPCSDTLALCQWVRPVTDPALLSCWAALVVLTWHVSTSSRKQHLNYVKCLPRD